MSKTASEIVKRYDTVELKIIYDISRLRPLKCLSSKTNGLSLLEKDEINLLSRDTLMYFHFEVCLRGKLWHISFTWPCTMRRWAKGYTHPSSRHISYVNICAKGIWLGFNEFYFFPSIQPFGEEIAILKAQYLFFDVQLSLNNKGGLLKGLQHRRLGKPNRMLPFPTRI